MRDLKSYIPMRGLKRLFPRDGGTIAGPAALAVQITITPLMLLHVSPRVDSICSILSLASLAVLVYAMKGGIMWPSARKN
jgi:hypothetical protein